MKLLINKLKLKLLLEEKRDSIRHSTEGIDIIISAILYIVSLLCSDFRSIGNVNALVIETLAWVIAVLLLLYGLYKIIYSHKHKYDHHMLYTDIENLNEIIHPFSIVAIKDTFNTYANRYLLYYDKAWDCWFFFSFHTAQQQNEESITRRLSNKLKIDPTDINIQYITDRLQPKFSEKDQINKVYQHSLYQGIIAQYPDFMTQDEFDIDGTLYRWHTIEQMEDDTNIMSKNKDVVSFVKEKIG